MQKKEGDLVTTSLGFEFRLQFPCGSPSTELSDFRQTTRSGNERNNIEKNVKAYAKGNDVIANVISANQHFTSTFFKADIKF